MSAELGRRVGRRGVEPPPVVVGRGPACVGVDPETFFGPADSEDPGRAHEWERRALEVCRSCAVRRPCLAEALRYPGPTQFGVVGGMTAAQRREVLAGSATQDATDPLGRARAAVAELAEHQPRPVQRPGVAAAAGRGRVPAPRAAEHDALAVEGVAR